MKCLLDGREVPAHAFTVQSLNFGQPWPAPAQPLSYSIQIEGPELVVKMNAELKRAKEEEIADLPFQHPGEVPEIDQWEEAGYPLVGELLAKHPRILEGVLRWLAMETLERILPHDPGSQPYVINNVERITVLDGMVLLDGRAYDRKPTPMGQTGDSHNDLAAHKEVAGRLT
jgi:hypothetical protein